MEDYKPFMHVFMIIVNIVVLFNYFQCTLNRDMSEEIWVKYKPWIKYGKGTNRRRGHISFLLPQKFIGIKTRTMHVLTRDFYFDSSGKTLLPKRDGAPVFLNSRVQEKQTRGKHGPTPLPPNVFCFDS